MDDIDDAALFESVVGARGSAEGQEPLAPEPKVEAPEPEAKVTTEQPRDESGKFATKSQDAASQAETQAEQTTPEREPAIPPHRLKEEADARRAEKERADRLEQMLTQLLHQRVPVQQAPQQQEPPDIFTDPEAWFQHKRDQEIAPMLERIQAARLEDARAVASVVYGDETVKAAEQAFNELAERQAVNPVEYERIKSSANPFRAAVEWHKRNSILSKMGDNPEAYIEAEVARRLAEAGQGGQQTQQTNAPPTNVVKIPASLSKATSAAPANQGSGQVMSDAELFTSITSRRR